MRFPPNAIPRIGSGELRDFLPGDLLLKRITPETAAKIFDKPVAHVLRTWDAMKLPMLPAERRAIKRLKASQPEPAHREFFSIPELAERWRCSRGTVYNRLRKAAVKVMDWSAGGEKGKKAVRASEVYEIENRRMKRLA